MSVLSHQTPEAFFAQELQEALGKQRLQLTDEAYMYVTLLLSGIRSGQEVGDATDALAPRYLQALRSGTPAERRLHLRWVGDSALLTCGWWWRFLDLMRYGIPGEEYHASMGRRAYLLIEGQDRALYAELSEKFLGLIDVLARMSSKLHDPNDDGRLMKVFSVWFRGQSRHAERILQDMGVDLGPMTRGPQ